MTAVRLSPLQRQVLEQLAHIRVAPEDATLGTVRLAQLVGAKSNAQMADSLFRLEIRGLVEVTDGHVARPDAWRITDKGREALG